MNIPKLFLPIMKIEGSGEDKERGSGKEGGGKERKVGKERRKKVSVPFSWPSCFNCAHDTQESVPSQKINKNKIKCNLK